MATTTQPLAPKKRRGGTPYVLTRAVHRIVTGDAFTDRNLSSRARTVLAVVVSRASCTDAGAPRWSGRAYIAERLGCSERTAIRRIGELVDAGLLEYAGQARSRGSGRFLNGHLRLTRRACEVLGLPWLSIPGPAASDALDRVTVIPTRRARATRTPDMSDQALPTTCGEAAPGATIGTRPVVAPSLRSGDSEASSLVQKQSPAPITGRGIAYDPAFVTVGGWRLPRELLWMQVQANLAPPAILRLMKIATLAGKRLSDVVAVERPRLGDKRGRHLFGYLRRLLAKPVDYAHLRRQQTAATARKATRDSARARLITESQRLAGSRWLLSDGTPLEVTASGSHVCWSAPGQGPVSRPFDADFLHAVAVGRVRPMPGADDPGNAASAEER